MKSLIAFIVILLVSGCTTIHFDQAEPIVKDSSNSHSAWHHNMVLSLVEVSEPVDLQAQCGSSEWASVTTETSFWNGLVQAIPYMSWIWTPKTVTVQCQG